MAETNETLLSFWLKNVPNDALPSQPPPHTLHLFASNTPDDPLAVLKRIIATTTALESSVNAYSSLSIGDSKLVSILRQSTSLISSLHTVSKNNTEVCVG